MSPSFASLNTGSRLPHVGLGCFMGSPGGGELCHKMCTMAIKLGYRHLDTAAGYGNEEHVGQAVRESGIPRSEFFITTKLDQKDHGQVEKAFHDSLRKLNLEYIDLYLMHWPQAIRNGVPLQPHESPTYVETWKAMESLLGTGKVKAIGVSNFTIKTLEVLLPHVDVVPAVCQVQMHPCFPQHELLEYCKTKGIHVTAYTPIGNAKSPFFFDETAKAIASSNGITIGQLLLSWGVQRGTSVIPKSEKEERLRSNFKTVKLNNEDFEAMNNLHKKPGMHRQLLDSPVFDWENGTCISWTFEQIGWNWDKKGYVLDP